MLPDKTISFKRIQKKTKKTHTHTHKKKTTGITSL